LLGGQIDPRQNPTRSHVLVGVKGAAAGSALEQSNDGTSFVSVGHSPDVRTLAAAVSTVIIEKSEHKSSSMCIPADGHE